MASDRQLIANRANAVKSKGPRSLAGKRRSSRNAMKHRLTADHTLLPGEDAEEFRGLKGAMFSSLRPEGALENQLVERAASLIWRMRRIQIFEGALFAWTAEYQRRAYDDDIEVQEGTELVPNDPGIDAHEELADELKLGRAFEALLSADLTGKLTRYERACSGASNQRCARCVRCKVRACLTRHRHHSGTVMTTILIGSDAARSDLHDDRGPGHARPPRESNHSSA